MHICMCMYVCVYDNVTIWVYEYMDGCMNVRAEGGVVHQCMCMDVCVHVCIPPHVCMYTYMYG